MLLRLAACVVVMCVVVMGVVVRGAGAQQQQVRAAAADNTDLLKLVAPAAASQLQKRNTKDNAALATGFTGHHGHHHHNTDHHLGSAGHHLGNTGHHLGHGHHGGKFFMYAHQPEHKHYEFGFKRGNDKHVVERYEKGGPHHDFKTKFRWHDKHGGHGERYWDYNHGDSHHHDDGGDDGGHGHHSEPVPEFVQPGAPYSKDSSSTRHRRKSTGDTQGQQNIELEKTPTAVKN